MSDSLDGNSHRPRLGVWGWRQKMIKCNEVCSSGHCVALIEHETKILQIIYKPTIKFAKSLKPETRDALNKAHEDFTRQLKEMQAKVSHLGNSAAARKILRVSAGEIRYIDGESFFIADKRSGSKGANYQEEKKK